MVASVGVFALAVCVISALMVVVVGLTTFTTRLRLNLQVDVPVHLAFFSSLMAILLLGYAFVSNDFSLVYVSSHSNTQLPIFFQIAAVWGGHEGSLLFWLVTLSSWNSVIALQKNSIPSEYRVRVMMIMAAIIVTFALFVLLASNPFATNSVMPIEGRDLNPMLQDIGLVLHPPLLYIGYVGFAATFAFAFAALLMPKIPEYWFKLCRAWNAIAWVFLTLGIILGSWWAYKELGWGGWWFWDPVENASLLPWLTSTALMHSLQVSHAKQQLKGWSFSLAIITFCLSLLGTFVVRSGVLTSVHAFAVDPTKGLLLLAILAILLFGALTALILRSEEIVSRGITAIFSKGGVILLACGLLAVATLVVWLGTFYPMVYQLLGLGNISVGAPYFNQMILPVTFVGLLLMLVSGIKSAPSLAIKCAILIGSALVLTFLMFYSAVSFSPLLIGASYLVIVVVVLHGLPARLTGLFGSVPMRIAHIGLAIAIFGAIGNAELSYEVSDKMYQGNEVQFRDTTITFDDRTLFIGPNYTSEKVHFILSKENEVMARLIPEKRHYQVRNMLMSEPAIHSDWLGDVYLTLGEKLDNQSYAVRIQYKAYIRWIWFGGLLSAFAVFLALIPKKVFKLEKRYVEKSKAQ